MRYELRRLRAEAWDVMRIASADESVRMLVLAIGVILLAWAASGCGASALETHGRVATALDVAAAESALIIRDQRRVAMEAEGALMVESGSSEAAALVAVQRVGDRWAPAVEAHAAYDRLVRTYVRGYLLAQLSGDDVALGSVAHLAVAALQAYDRVRRLVAELAGEAVLPALPAFVVDLLRSVSTPASDGGAR
jgi:hypothetical protein